MITKIICEASNVNDVNSIGAVKVDLEDDGRVIIYHSDKEVIDKTKEMILNVSREVEQGEIYSIKVLKVEDFGCVIELWLCCEWFVHIPQLAIERVNKTEDVVSVGDTILVKAMGLDKRGKQSFSRKEALKEMKQSK